MIPFFSRRILFLLHGAFVFGSREPSERTRAPLEDVSSAAAVAFVACALCAVSYSSGTPILTFTGAFHSCLYRALHPYFLVHPFLPSRASVPTFLVAPFQPLPELFIPDEKMRERLHTLSDT